MSTTRNLKIDYWQNIQIGDLKKIEEFIDYIYTLDTNPYVIPDDFDFQELHRYSFCLFFFIYRCFSFMI